MLFSFASNIFSSNQSNSKEASAIIHTPNDDGNIPPPKAPKTFVITNNNEIKDVITPTSDVLSDDMKSNPENVGTKIEECISSMVANDVNNNDVISTPVINNDISKDIVSSPITNDDTLLVDDAMITTNNKPIKAPKIVKSIVSNVPDINEVITVDVIQRISPVSSCTNLVSDSIDDIRDVVEEIVVNAINIQNKSATGINTKVIYTDTTLDIINNIIQDVTDKVITITEDSEIDSTPINPSHVANSVFIESGNTQLLATDAVILSKSNGRENNIDVKNDICTHANDDKKFVLLKGQYKNGKLDGECVCNFLNDDFFQGEFVDGKKNGTGKYTFSDKSYYYGSYRNDMRHGLGEFVFCNGERYSGMFYNGKFDGKGSYHFVNTDNENFYEGQFLDGCFHGYGIMKYLNGDILEGEWQYDRCHGNGLMKYNNGDVYDGKIL